MNISLDKINLLTLNVGFAVHDGDWNWENVQSPFARLYLVTKGSALIICQDEEIILQSGYLYLIPPFKKHTDICTGHFEHYYIHIYEDPSSECRIFNEFEFPSRLQMEKLDTSLMKRMCEINPTLVLPQSNPYSYDNSKTLAENIRKNRMREISTKMESNGIVLQLLSKFLRTARQKYSLKDNRMQTVMEYIIEHLCENPEINELAAIACMSPDHFIRTFKMTIGETPKQYISRRLVEQAQILLSTSALSIKSIAEGLGYADYSYFIRMFKKKTGQTPHQYRDLYKWESA